MHWHLPNRRPTVDLGDIEEIIAKNVALAGRFDPAERAKLVDLTVGLVGAKRWEPLAPLELTPEVAVTIAANAAIPVMNLDPSPYGGVRSIIVRASTVVSTGNRAGPVGGVTSSGPLATIGQAAPQSGPISISWDAALADSRRPETGRNVVIHEFAHKIDMSDGSSDGTPPLRGPALDNWMAVLADEYQRADARPGDEVLRAYAWTNAAEFFAVATEAFFCLSAELAAAKPKLYSALAAFYRQDPAVL
jgi:Mlc titration factor MtfA (ptsG expression regulator)